MKKDKNRARNLKTKKQQQNKNKTKDKSADKNIEDINEDISLSYLSEQMASPSFGEFFDKQQLSMILSGKDSEALILTFSGLCFEKLLHSDLVVIESIIHQSLLAKQGNDTITMEIAKDLFKIFQSSYIGNWSDPSEDVMVGAINTELGTFKILEGLWESCGFYSERFTDIVSGMPKNENYESLRNSVYGLLKIANLSVERAGLERYDRGNETPVGDLYLDQIINVSSIKTITYFTLNDIESLGLNEECLNPFILSEQDILVLRQQRLGESILERKPILRSRNGNLILALPTSVGIAIRFFILEWCEKYDLLQRLEQSYQLCYINYFYKKSKLLGVLSGFDISFIKNSKGKVIGSDSIIRLDEGRYIHFVLSFDDFDGYRDGLINSVSPNVNIVSTRITTAIFETQKKLSSQPGFVRGLSLVAVCGWGRVVLPSLGNKIDDKKWDVEFTSASDLDTFNNIQGMSPLTFWRLIEAKRTVREAGVITQNVNGLLNLYSWAKNNNDNIIPHEALSDELSSAFNLFMMIEQNALVETRWETKFDRDEHMVKNPRGELIRVSRLVTASYFEEDRFKPIYVSVTDIEQHILIGLIKGKFTNWWCRPKVLDGQDRSFIYRLWEGICSWILRLDSVLYEKFSYRNEKEILVEFEVEELSLPSVITEQTTLKQLENLSLVKFKESRLFSTLEITLLEGYLMGFHQHNNFAEGNIVRLLIETVSKKIMLVPDENTQEEIFRAVVKNDIGKSIHMYSARFFIDYVKASLPNPITLDGFDYASSKIGMGWIGSVNKGTFSYIEGKTECTDYLQQLTFHLYLQIKSGLHDINKSQLINFLLLQIEAIDADSVHWQRTFPAIRGLHLDQDNVYDVVTKKISSNGAALTAIRILLEMSICEATNSSTRPPNELDVSKLIVFATSIFEYGNLSDAIHFEMVNPTIRITALGDIHFDHSFYHLVVAPYGNQMQSKLIDRAAKKYENYYSEDEFDLTPDKSDDDDFEDAWQDEYGLNFEKMGKILDVLDSIGIEKGMAIFTLSEQALLASAKQERINEEELNVFLSAYTMISRKKWDEIPCGFKTSDISPWRFKRRLSAIARPIFKIDDNYIISPNFIRKGIGYLITNSYDGSLDGSFFKSNSMKKRIGKTRNITGHKFNREAKGRLEQLGLLAESDVKVSKILGARTEKDFGDVDVLAWSVIKGSVYLIECKDLEFAKTQGEIAKQVYDYRGKVRHDGKDDRLKKHIERCNKLKDNLEILKTYLNIPEIKEIHIVLLFKQVVPIPFHNPINTLPIKIVFFEKLNLLFENGGT